MAVSTPFRVHSCALFALLAVSATAQTNSNPVFVARAQADFNRAQAAYTAQPTETNALRLGRATYYWAEYATNETQRADVARVGIAACHEWVGRKPKSAGAHYYLAIDDGELAEAQAPSLAAYRLVHEIEHEFKTAADLDVTVDFAGPARCLGLLYRDAPGWPLSIGSKHKAHDWLTRAATLAPDYPENQLNVAETAVRWHQAADAEAALKKLDAIWPAAQKNLKGQEWEAIWADWTQRRAAVRADFEKTFKRPPKAP
ncbi:MAG TPA: hypothetical protein VF988_17765 [Verrucomicrobiae bacterium]